MAEPQIRYVRTSDGVNLALSELGAGPRMVGTNTFPYGNFQKEWQIPQVRNWSLDIARRYRLIRYDSRGRGLSDRDVGDVSLATHVRDLAAVIEATGDEPCIVFAAHDSGMVGVAYAAEYPERVSHLVLWCAYARVQQRVYSERERAVYTVGASDWALFVDAMVLLVAQHPDMETARRWRDFFASSMTSEVFAAQFEAMQNDDVTALLPTVKVPTLVLHREGLQRVNMGAARELAASIPNARLIAVPGSSGAPFDHDPLAVTRIVDDFVGIGPVEPAATGELRSGTAVVLFADIADSTALTERMGDAAFREKARALDDELRLAVRDNGGAVIDAKTLGDGILATFPAASQAIAAALACGAAGNHAGLPLHLGLHAGDVIRESDNVFGGAVNVAARISALAPPGEVLVSATVRDLGRTSAGVAFDDRGEHALKGIAEPQRVYAVRQQTT